MNEFSTQLHHAIDAFSAPPVPLNAISERGRSFQYQERRRSFKSIYAALILSCSAVAVALGAEALHNIGITFNPLGKTTVTTPTLTCQWKNVTPEMVNYVSQLAAYPVSLPTGLPERSRVNLLCNAGPDALLLFYAYPRPARSNGSFEVLISRPEQAAISRSTLARGVTMRIPSNGSGKHWMVGQEEILVLGTTLSSEQIDRVEQSMKYAPKNRACYLVTRNRRKIRIPCQRDTQ